MGYITTKALDGIANSPATTPDEKVQLAKMRQNFGDEATFSAVGDPRHTNVKSLLKDIAQIQTEAAKNHSPIAGELDKASDVLAAQFKNNPDLVGKLSGNLTPANVKALEQAIRTNVGGVTQALPALLNASSAEQFAQTIPAQKAAPSGPSAPSGTTTVASTSTVGNNGEQHTGGTHHHGARVPSATPASETAEATGGSQTPPPPAAQTTSQTTPPPTTGQTPAASGSDNDAAAAASLKMTGWLAKNDQFGKLYASLNDDQKQVVLTTFTKMSGDNGDMLDQLAEEQRKHPDFFNRMLTNLQNGPKDAAGFQTALTDSMNSVKTLGGVDMIMGFLGKFLVPLLKDFGMDKFAASLTDGSFAEKIAGNKMASTEIAKTVDEAAPMISMVSGLFNDNSGASPKANGQPATPQTNVAATTGATPSLPSGNLVGTSTNSYATTASATPGQTVAVNGATYSTVNPTLVAASPQPNPFLQPHL